MEIIKPQDCSISFTDEFFFDTNIWIILFASIANVEENDQRIYSKFLEDIISRQNPIYITSNIISEFSNVLLRRDFNQWKLNSGHINPKFKEHFIPTKNYKNSVEFITASLNKIFSLPNVIKIPDNFNSVNLDKVLEDFKLIDFNDSYIVQIGDERFYLN